MLKKDLIEKVYFVIQKADYLWIERMIDGEFRKNENIYLGKRVKDTGKPGLDNLSEVEGICRCIIEDYKSGRISYRTAMSRLNLLSLIVKKSKKFPSDKKPKARDIIEKYREELKKLREEKKK